jgi:hypothetical protein
LRFAFRRDTLNVFIGGIMQGSRRDRYIDDQDYRRLIAEAILEVRPGTVIVDPNEIHPDGTEYDDEAARKTLLDLFELAGQADLLVAYAPQASMGTAIEMWQAYQAGAPLITISPMAANWVVRHLSTVVVPNLEAFREWLASGGLDKLAELN